MVTSNLYEAPTFVVVNVPFDQKRKSSNCVKCAISDHCQLTQWQYKESVSHPPNKLDRCAIGGHLEIRGGGHRTNQEIPILHHCKIIDGRNVTFNQIDFRCHILERYLLILVNCYY